MGGIRSETQMKRERRERWRARNREKKSTLDREITKNAQTHNVFMRMIAICQSMSLIHLLDCLETSFDCVMRIV